MTSTLDKSSVTTDVKVGWFGRKQTRLILTNVKMWYKDDFQYRETRSLFSSVFTLMASDCTEGHDALGIALGCL